MHSDAERARRDAHEGVPCVIVADLDGLRIASARDFGAERDTGWGVAQPQPKVTPSAVDEPLSVPSERRYQRRYEGRRGRFDGDARRSELRGDGGARVADEGDELRRAAYAPWREALHLEALREGE